MEGNKMKYEKPNMYVIYRKDVILTSDPYLDIKPEGGDDSDEGIDITKI